MTRYNDTSTTKAGQPNLNIALDLARQAIPVFPVGPDKRPKVKGWPDKATTDARQIERWFGKWSDAMPGIPTGPRSGFAVLDLDRKNGKDGFAAIRKLGLDPDALSPVIVESPGGSRHLYFRYAEGLRSTADQIAPGVDTRAAGGYVVAPGAVTPKGPYRLVSGSLKAELPVWPDGLEAAVRPPREPGEGQPTGLPFHVIESALKAIPNEAQPYGFYLDTGMALHAEAGGSDEGLAAWQEWCARNGNNDPALNEAKWRGFKAGGGVTGWTILAEAERQGWSDPAVAELRRLERIEEDTADLDAAWSEADQEAMAIAALVGDPSDAATKEPEADPLADVTGGPQPSRLTFLTPADCATLPARPYVMKGLLAEGDVAAIVGAPGAGKSLLAPRLGYAVAQGQEVFGRRTKPGLVFYVAAEDGHGMRARLSALRQDHGEAASFRLVGGVSDLLSKKGELAELQRAVEAQRPKLIVIDTLAVAFPGLEENSAEGMGQVVAAARSLAQWGAAVVLIHHDTKAGDGLPRGHSLLNGALDVALYLKRDEDVVTGRPSKNRNGTTEQELAFTIVTRKLGVDEDGDPITTAVAEEMDPADAPKRGPRLSPAAKAALAIWHRLAEGGDAVDEDDWRTECTDGREVSAAEKRESRRDAFSRAVRILLDAEVLTFRDGAYHRVMTPAEWRSNPEDDFSEEDVS